MLEVAASAGSLLGLVAHYPVFVATLLRTALVTAGRSGNAATDAVLAALPALRSARVLQLLCVVAVLVRCLRQVERDAYFVQAVAVVAINAAVVVLTPAHSIPTILFLTLFLHCVLLPRNGLKRWRTLQWRSPISALPHGLTGMASMLSGGVLVSAALRGHFKLHATWLLPFYVASTMVNATAGALIAGKAPSATRGLFKAAGVFQAALAYYCLRFAGPLTAVSLPGGAQVPTVVLRSLDCAMPLLLVAGLGLFLRGACQQKEPLMGAAVLVGVLALCLLAGYPLQLLLGGDEWRQCVQAAYPLQATGFTAFVYVPATWCFGAVLFGATLLQRGIISTRALAGVFLLMIPAVVLLTVLVQEVHIPVVSTQKLWISCPPSPEDSLAARIEATLDFSRLANAVLDRLR